MKKILLVDDDLTHQKFLSRFLSKYYLVDTSSTAKEFYEKTRINTYDAVLMDLILKDNKTGLDLIKDIKKRKNFKEVPIIVFSGSIKIQDRIDAYEIGANIFINKPLDYPKLLEIIKNSMNEMLETT